MPVEDVLAHFLKTEGAVLPIDAIRCRKRIHIDRQLISSPILPITLNRSYWLSYATTFYSKERQFNLLFLTQPAQRYPKRVSRRLLTQP